MILKLMIFALRRGSSSKSVPSSPKTWLAVSWWMSRSWMNVSIKTGSSDRWARTRSSICE